MPPARATDWTPPAQWTMGLLDPAEWKAAWIGRERATAGAGKSADQGQLDLVRRAGRPTRCYPCGHRWFRHVLDVPADRKVVKAVAYFAADNSHQLWVNGEMVGNGGSFEAAEAVDLREALHPGANLVALDCREHGRWR